VVARIDPLTADADANDSFLFHGWDVVPMLDGSLPASAKPLLYFVEQKEAELPAPDSSGAIHMAVSAVARPGKCEIKITALQGLPISGPERHLHRRRSVIVDRHFFLAVGGCAGLAAGGFAAGSGFSRY
jgi:hypothetical protein